MLSVFSSAEYTIMERYLSDRSHSSDYHTQFNTKLATLTQLLAPFTAANTPSIECFASVEQGYRMRAEFRFWHETDECYHVMFDPLSKKPYRVSSFPAAYPLIQAAMTQIERLVPSLPPVKHKLFQVDYLTSTRDELLISLLYHRPLDDIWQQNCQRLKQQLEQALNTTVDIIGRAKKQKVLIDRDFVTETLLCDAGRFDFVHTENSFTQPNAMINVDMMNWLLAQTEQCTSRNQLLELYCGAGNFTIPLATRFQQVVATEISKTSIAAANRNLALNHISNVHFARLSSEEFVQACKGVRQFRRLQGMQVELEQFDAVLVDPPRSGLDCETIALVRHVPVIFYISCNPQTLCQNLSHLNMTHEVVSAAFFDQFPFTPHIEAGVVLKRKANQAPSIGAM